MDQGLKNEIGHFKPIPSSLCGSLDLCESAQSAIAFRFAHLNIKVLILFRISCFVFRIFSSLYLLLSPAGALQLSRLLYKSPSFLQNKANVKMGKMTISTTTLKAYANEQRAMSNERYSKQSQSKPIPNAETAQWCEESHPTLPLADWDFRSLRQVQGRLFDGSTKLTAGKLRPQASWRTASAVIGDFP
jgi:hypothetical protein